MSERESVGTSERDQLSEIIFIFSGFTAAIAAHSISEEVAGFFLYGFPKENLCVYYLLWLIGVHVILLNKILMSYCLNDKKLKWYQS